MIAYAQQAEQLEIGFFSGLSLIVVAFIVLVLCFVFAKALELWLRRYLTKKQKEYITIEHSKTAIVFAGRVVFLGVMAFGVVIALTISQIVTEMGWLLGALGLAAGIAARGFFSNYVAGMLLLIQEKTKAGHVIEINGVRGKIVQVGIRSTLVRQFDGPEVIIPNIEFFEQEVIIFNAVDMRRIHIPITLRYRTDVQKATELILEILKQEKTVLVEKPMGVLVRHFGHAGVTLEIRYWISPKSGWFRGKSRILQMVKRQFDAAHITVSPVSHKRYIEEHHTPLLTSFS